jgi:multidrug resistance protein, MATE family
MATSTDPELCLKNGLQSNDTSDAMKNEHTPLLSKPTADTIQSEESILKTKNSSSFLEEDHSITPSIWVDSKDTVLLGIPIFLSMLSWVGMKTTDTALLGHVSADALGAAALSDIWTMCSGVLIQGRVLSVLCGSAVGAGNPKLAGIYLQVSYYVLSYIVLFVILLWCITRYVWVWFGTAPEIAAMAGYYAQILALSLPGQMLFSQLSQFFSSQMIMYPEVNAASIATIANLLFGLFFVLGIPLNQYGFNGYGFVACPIVTSFMVYLQLFIVVYFYMYKQRLHEPCWDGWSYQEITRERIKTFINLYMPAALGLSSDFWRVAAVGTVAAKLGTNQVAVFNASYRIMWIALVLVSALSSAAGIKMSARLGNLNHIGAKQAGEVGIMMSTIVLGIVAALILWNVRWFSAIFTSDPDFIALFEEAKFPFVITLVLMNLAVAIERIPYSMGRTTEVFWFGLVASWAGQVPAVILLTKYWRNDLNGLFYGMAIGYGVLVALYSYIVIESDWKKYAEIAHERSEMKK